MDGMSSKRIRKRKHMRIPTHITYPHTKDVVDVVPLTKGDKLMEETNKPDAVEPPQRTPQQVLDSIVGMLFNQHKQQIYKYMLELEKQITLESNAKNDIIDIAKKPE